MTREFNVVKLPPSLSVALKCSKTTDNLLRLAWKWLVQSFYNNNLGSLTVLGHRHTPRHWHCQWFC